MGRGWFGRAMPAATRGPTAAVSVGTISISGTVTIGGTLTSSLGGTWSPSPTYQWQRGATWDGGGSWSNIGSATGSTYSPVQADIGFSLRCVATNSGGSANSNTLIYDPTTVSAVFEVFKIRTLSAGSLSTLTGAKGAITLSQGTGSKQPVVGATSFNSTVGLTFDGTDDYMSGAANFSSLGAVRIVAGMLDTSTAASIFLEHTSTILNAHAFTVAINAEGAGLVSAYASSGASAYGSKHASETLASACYMSFCADTSITTGCQFIRKNGSALSLTTDNSGCTPAANFANDTLYLGERGGVTAPWAGTIGGALMILSGTAQDSDLSDAEAYVKNGGNL